MQLKFLTPGAVAVIATALVACREVPSHAVEDTSYRLRPGYIVDSVRPIEVELERFRADLGPAPAALAGGAASMAELLSRFARAIEARDTTSLQRMQISAAEFAWLIYPSSPFTKPPYRETPQMVWAQLRMGDVGLKRLVERRGGSPLRIVSRQCDPEPLIEGDNRLWRRCEVRTVGASGDTLSERLFGVVIERAGHFKFASYQNQY